QPVNRTPAARPGPRRYLDIDVTVERRHADASAERRFRDGHVDRGEDVVPLAHEALVRPHVDEHIGVARLSSARGRVAPAGDADPLPVVDARRNGNVERALLDPASPAPAALARA